MLLLTYVEPLSLSEIPGRDLQYFKHTFDDEWVRTTDFSESFSIRQASAMCSEIPYGCKLPNFRENFHYYTEDEVSRSLDLVPVVAPPDGHKLRYDDILFKVNFLVQNGYLSAQTLDTNFFRMNLFHLQNCCYEPVKWLTEQYLEYSLSANPPRSTSISLSDGLVYVRRVLITPLVLRYYREHINNFIRISFVDEDSEKVRSTDIYTLLVIRSLNFLPSQHMQNYHVADLLRWQEIQTSFASKGSLTAASIWDWMADFRNIVYTFSHGIGKVSSEFAHKVASKCGLKCMPSALVWWIQRCHQCKFKSKVTKLDVLSWSKFQPCFLNRQVISLWFTLGVKAVDQLDSILTDPLKAYEALEIMSPAETTNILKELLLCGYKPDQEPFLSMMLQTFRAAKLLRVGRSIMGCLDETATLEYGQVFVQVSRLSRNKLCGNSFSMLNGNGPADTVGKVVVPKNPCLHPGDMRVLQAVNVPALHHMVDCVVFPQKEQRPHPNECSGSDLDGDVYFVCWDQELIPPRQVEPMDYDASPAIELNHDVQIEEVEEYFVNYMINDSLGVIANTHTAFADKEQLKAESEECIELAKLFSIAVDFPMTGVPAPDFKEYPDFMEKLDRPTYESKRVIGKLFRQVKDIASHTSHIKSFTLEVAKILYDTHGIVSYTKMKLHHDGEDFVITTWGDSMKLHHDMIKTEAEILGGSIMKFLAVRALKKEARTWFDKKRTNSGTREDDDIYAKASAWYHKSREHFLGFPWCVYDKLIHIKKNNSMRRKHNRSLEDQFTSSLRLS
ncbi:hypothetical protein MKX03_019878 [Papaver bracteatum]|nr:hypothetical protein MKX03_019878 [Papaver bracteatum]